MLELLKLLFTLFIFGSIASLSLNYLGSETTIIGSIMFLAPILFTLREKIERIEKDMEAIKDRKDQKN